MDLVVRAQHFPSPGETVLGHEFLTTPGGKGANQAVAAARLNGQVAFLGKVGEDAFAQTLTDSMAEAGVDVSPMWRSLEPTGIAVITVRDDGENTIVVAPGANADLHPADVRRAFGEFEVAPKVVLAQA